MPEPVIPAEAGIQGWGDGSTAGLRSAIGRLLAQPGEGAWLAGWDCCCLVPVPGAPPTDGTSRSIRASLSISPPTPPQGAAGPTDQALARRHAPPLPPTRPATRGPIDF